MAKILPVLSDGIPRLGLLIAIVGVTA